MKIEDRVRFYLWLVCIVLMPLMMGASDLSGGGCVGVLPANSFSVGGSISGLSGTVVLQNNLGDNLTLTNEGSFTFSKAIANGATYSVTVLTEPSDQTCTATNNTGIVNGSNVINVSVICSTNVYSLGGTVSGLSGTVVLQNNGSDNLSITSSGNFLFTTELSDGSSYDVTIFTQPSGQTCTVSNGSGQISGSDISNVSISCQNNDATLSVSGSPLGLETNGPSGDLTITNISLDVTALNITSSFTGTALDGNVVETGNTCASVAPGASCTLTFTPGSTVVAQTDFLIQGSNTNAVTAAIFIIQSVSLTNISPDSGSASGGTGFTLTGMSLTGATTVTFDGIAATSINVVDSTTVTGVTPAHAAGAVDVEITTPDGTATLTNGYTYLTTAVGQSAHGGTIACLNGGLNDLVAATADNSAGIEWGSLGVATSATSTTDGAINTATVIATLGANGGTPYAAQLCDDYEVDSQGNTPCETGNTCYNDWFLPAGNNTGVSGQLNCLYTNKVAIGGFSDFYWSSTEVDSNNARFQALTTGAQGAAVKAASVRVRCVRGFTP